MVLLQIGGANRALRGTEANEASSRSHELLQLSIEVEINQGGSTVIRKAKLNLVRQSIRCCWLLLCLQCTRTVTVMMGRGPVVALRHWPIAGRSCWLGEVEQAIGHGEGPRLRARAHQ